MKILDHSIRRQPSRRNNCQPDEPKVILRTDCSTSHRFFKDKEYSKLGWKLKQEERRDHILREPVANSVIINNQSLPMTMVRQRRSVTLNLNLKLIRGREVEDSPKDLENHFIQCSLEKLTCAHSEAAREKRLAHGVTNHL